MNMSDETIYAMEIDGFTQLRGGKMMPKNVKISCTGHTEFTVTFEESKNYKLNDTIRFSRELVN
jgi:hypothetical protein